MVKHRIIFLFFNLSICFLSNSQSPSLLKEKTQNSIQNYINQKLGEKQIYEPIGFGELKIIKPKEYVKLDELEAIKNKSEEQNLEIEKLKKQIEKLNVSYILEMKHTFILYENQIRVEIIETNYLLNESFEIIDFEPIIFLNTIMPNRNLFLKYYKQAEIFKVESYETSLKFYDFFKTELYKRNTIKGRSDFLEHFLFLMNEVNAYGEFNQIQIIYKISKNYLGNNFKKYTPVIYSQLYEIKKEDKLQGYYFFHKFIYSNENNEEEILVYYLKFSPYYELENVTQMQKPYEKYFSE